MKRMILVGLIAMSMPVAADEVVQGHIRKDGTYVAPYVRSTPNRTTLDNYSTQGNQNPYTGQRGSASPYPQPNYGYQQPQAPTYPAYQAPRQPSPYQAPRNPYSR